MEFRDLKKQYQILKKDIDNAVFKVMSNSNFISGVEVTELEEQLSEYVGVKHCITCGNGTDALVLALMAMGVGNGDVVFVPDFTFFASGEAPAICGATPVFVDVEEDTYNISVLDLEKKIKKVIEDGKLVPKAVIAVDLFGQPADYPKIREITKKYDLLLIEDGAQGFGGAIGEKKACSFGDISTTSFFPAKPLGCYGDGGAVFTDSDEWAEIIKSLRIHGKGQDKYDNVRIGMNSRLDTIQAAVLKVKLKWFIQYELEQVNNVAKWYNDELINFVKIPTINKTFYSSWAQYTILCENNQERFRIQNRLKSQNIPYAVYYSKAMHEQIAFKNMYIEKYKKTMFLKDRVLSLPIHPYMSIEQVKKVSAQVKGDKICG